MKNLKQLKTAIPILLALCLICALCGCRKIMELLPEETAAPVPGDGIAGDYYLISVTEADGTEIALGEEEDELHIREDGTGEFVYFGETYQIKWTLNDKDFSFVDEDGDEFKGTFVGGQIGGYYFDNCYYTFISDYEIYKSIMGNKTKSKGGVTEENEAYVYTMQTLYEDQYLLKTAYALVPYGWTVWVESEWGLISTTYPAAATICMTSPTGDAKIEIRSGSGYMQMSRNGVWTPEGTYLDLYNTYLNYRNSHDYNVLLFEKLGLQGTEEGSVTPNASEQAILDEAAKVYLQSFSASGINLVGSEGSSAKTTFNVTQDGMAKVEILTAVLMAETTNGIFRNITWTAPYHAFFFAETEEAYEAYKDTFMNVFSNSSFSEEFMYINMRNAQYINEQISNYLLEKAYNPSSGDISSWDSEYVDSGTDSFINEWCDVIKEQNEYTLEDGSKIKVSTDYDTVYQDGEQIYMGPDAQSPDGWTRLYPN